jgi:DNA topoisomerase-2
MADVSYMIDDDSECSVDAFSNDSDFEDDFVEIPPAPKQKIKASVKPAKKTSKSTAIPKITKKVISLDDDEDDIQPPAPLAERNINQVRSDSDAVKGKNKSKTVEQTYTKMSQLEHILKRPDTYSKCFTRINYRSI